VYCRISDACRSSHRPSPGPPRQWPAPPASNVCRLGRSGQRRCQVGGSHIVEGKQLERIEGKSPCRDESLPENLFNQIEAEAKSIRNSRSDFDAPTSPSMNRRKVPSNKKIPCSTMMANRLRSTCPSQLAIPMLTQSSSISRLSPRGSRSMRVPMSHPPKTERRSMMRKSQMRTSRIASDVGVRITGRCQGQGLCGSAPQGANRLEDHNCS